MVAIVEQMLIQNDLIKEALQEGELDKIPSLMIGLQSLLNELNNAE